MCVSECTEKETSWSARAELRKRQKDKKKEEAETRRDIMRVPAEQGSSASRGQRKSPAALNLFPHNRLPIRSPIDRIIDRSLGGTNEGITPVRQHSKVSLSVVLVNNAQTLGYAFRTRLPLRSLSRSSTLGQPTSYLVFARLSQGRSEQSDTSLRMSTSPASLRRRGCRCGLRRMYTHVIVAEGWSGVAAF